MGKEFWLVALIVLFGLFVYSVARSMIRDSNAVIRMMGYVVATIVLLTCLWLSAYFLFHVNLWSIILS